MVRECERVTFCKDEQNWNAYLPMEMTLFGIVIFFRDVHEVNAASSMTCTEVGMWTIERLVHP